MTIIVPVDFSPQSINAASFAVHMLSRTYNAELILYHFYRKDSEEEVVLQSLQKIKDTLSQDRFVKMRCMAEKGNNFTESLTHLINREDATLVIMSVGERAELFDDSHSLQMMAQSSCPVLVIPHSHLYSEVKAVVLASDFKAVDKTIPLAKVKKVLNIFHPQLHIVHVNSKAYLSLNEELVQQRTLLEEMFLEYCPEFHFINTSSFAEGLDKFIKDKNIDLILTFPHKHSFFSSLTKVSNTKALVFKNDLPVLAAHE